MRRPLALLRFLFIFAREFLLANLAVARTVLSRKPVALHPDFIQYDLTGLTPNEILLLSHCITLTPGTCSVEVSRDLCTLVIHALDARDPDAVRTGIDQTLKAAILAFTR